MASSDSSPSSEPAIDGDKTTGFFSLPRELRDKIYDSIWQEHKHKIHAAYYIVNAAIPNVRLVSRQFRSEYDESSPANSFVLVFDMYGPCNNFKGFPRLGTYSTRLEVIWEDVCIRLCVNAVGHVGIIDIHLYIHTNDHLGRMVDELIACPSLADSITESLNPSGSTVTGPEYFADWSRERGFAVSNAKERKATLKVEAAREKKIKSETESAIGEDIESRCGKGDDGDGEEEQSARGGLPTKKLLGA